MIELQNTRENPYIPFTNPGTHLKIPKEPDSYLAKSPYLRKKLRIPEKIPAYLGMRFASGPIIWHSVQ